MKKLMMAVCVVLMGMGLQSMKAQGVYEPMRKVPFTIHFSQLSRFLNLKPSQLESVYQISDQFMAEQQEALSRGNARKKELMDRALKVNLKQMKETLSEAQYRSYVTLLNVTHNNRHFTTNNSIVTTVGNSQGGPGGGFIPWRP
ncbi:MAG: hypothetical protein ACI3ZY_02835 [Parabacteroides sp.]